MRIVIDMQGAQTGSRRRGIGRYTMCLVKAIVGQRRDHEIILALNGLFPDTLEAIRAEFTGILPQENIRVWRCIGPTNEANPANRWRREVSERMREAFLLALHPDVVLITSLFEGLSDDAVVSIGLLHDTIPTAVILYDLIPLISPNECFLESKVHIDWLRGRLANLRRSHTLLAISENSRRDAIQTLGFSEDEVVTISAACPESFRKLTLTEAERSELYGRLGIIKPFVLYTGGADQSKNLRRLLEGFARLPADLRLRHHLVLVGPIPEAEIRSLSETAKNAGLSAQDTLFTGYLSEGDLAKLYNTCSLFVFPSLYEGFGLPPLEAMACEAPVIGANATSLPEIIGLPEAMFDPHSIDEITGKIQQGLADEAFRKRLKENGQKQVRMFSWLKSATLALEALERLPGAHRFQASGTLKVERTAIFEKRYLRILVVKLDHLGDFLLAVPAITKLRAKYPDATIDAIVGSWNLEIARELNLFANIYAFDFFKAKSSERPSDPGEEWEALLRKLDGYDIAIDLRRQPEARHFLRKIKANLKVGYETLNPEVDNDLDIALPTYRDVRYKRTQLNRTATSRQILALIDSLPPNENDFIVLPDFGGQTRMDDGAVAIFPRAGMDGREWGRRNFEGLVERLDGCSLVRRISVYFAREPDARRFKLNRSKVTVKIALGFSELTQSLRTHAVCIANNSGGAHLASLLGVGVIGVYSGHELASEWGPQFNESYVIHRDAFCSPCHFGRRSECPNGNFCLGDISVDDVYGKTVEALSRREEFLRSRSKGLGRGGRGLISIQRSTESIVRELLESISGLVKKDDMTSLLEISMALCENHPDYPIGANVGCVRPGVLVDHHSPLVEWEGFSGGEAEFRWTDGKGAAMQFYYDDIEGIRPAAIVTLVFDTFGHQRIGISLNGVKIADGARKGKNLKLQLRVLNLKEGCNRLEFELPDAVVPDKGDTRRLGIAIRSLMVNAPEVVRFTPMPATWLGSR